jgi:predicted AAA+ superfamily ATPase
VGPKGSGKTTLMLELARGVQANGWEPVYVRLNESDRKLSLRTLEPLDAQTMVFLDGAEQLSGWRWRCFLRHVRPAGRVLISVHSRGRLPVVFQTSTGAELLQRLYQQLTHDRLEIEQCADLLARFDGNIRAVFHWLYREVAG